MSGRNLSNKARALEVAKKKDFDPEDEAFRSDDEDDESLDGQVNQKKANHEGREHYENVEKSRLRKPAQHELGMKYAAKAVSRTAMEDDAGDDSDNPGLANDPFGPADEDEDEDDPFASRVPEADTDNESVNDKVSRSEDNEVDDFEIDSDEAFGPGDEETFSKFKFSGSARAQQERQEKTRNGLGRDTESMAEDESEPDEHSLEESLDMDDESTDISMTDAENESDTDADSGDSASTSASDIDDEDSTIPATNREKLKALLKDDTAAVASNLSASAAADIEKGRAVKQQYHIYDRLLDARIKMQKGINAVNDLQDISDLDEEGRSAIQRAESSALKLWSIVNSIRHELQNAQEASGSTTNPKKRKASTPLTPSTTSLTDLWDEMNSFELKAKPQRRAVLDKWSSKTRPATSQPTSSRLLDASQQADQNKITVVLDTYLAEESNKIQPTRSDDQSSTPDNLSPYTDVQFYQTLLRDLITSRTSLQSSSFLPTVNTTKLHPSGSKHKKIDTKASKGRKVRYDVHEKLLNFMAPEDRGTWTDQAATEFFGSLFGGRGMLSEREQQGEEVTDREGEALRLFRS